MVALIVARIVKVDTIAFSIAFLPSRSCGLFPTGDLLPANRVNMVSATALASPLPKPDDLDRFGVLKHINDWLCAVRWLVKDAADFNITNRHNL